MLAMKTHSLTTMVAWRMSQTTIRERRSGLEQPKSLITRQLILYKMSGKFDESSILGAWFLWPDTEHTLCKQFCPWGLYKKNINGHCLTLLLPGVALLLGMNKRLTKKYRKERLGNKMSMKVLKSSEIFMDI